jgi:trigger factor
MDIVKHNIDEYGALLKVQIVKNDYEEKIKKSLSNYRRKAEIKGFRPGMAPMSLIQKMYGHAALIDEINKLISEALEKYLENEKLDIVGEPIPCEDEQQTIDWTNQSDFEFVYEIGYSPKYELQIDKLIKAPFYNISVSDDDKKKYIEELCKRHAKFTDADVISENDFAKVDINQQGESRINVNDAYVSLRMLKTDEQKALLLGLKVGETINVDINKLCNDEKHKASLLKIEEKELPTVNPEFNLTVKEIKTLKNAEVNQDLFDNLYGKDNVTSEEDFLQRITVEITHSHTAESNYKFGEDLRKILMTKANLKFPETFLKKWLILINENKLTSEEIDKGFDEFLKDLCWQTIINNIAKENDIKVDDDDIKTGAIEVARWQLRQYNLSELSDEQMEIFTQRILNDKNQVRKIIERSLERNVIAHVKSIIELDEKTISVDEFTKMIEETTNDDLSNVD